MRPQEDENGEAEHEEMVNRQTQSEAIAGKLAANLRLRMQRARQQQKQRRKFAHYWLSAEEEAEIVELRFGKDSCAARTVHWIQSHRVQTALLVMLALTWHTESDMTAELNAEYLDEVKKMIPLGRLGYASEVAGMCAFLVRPAIKTQNPKP